VDDVNTTVVTTFSSDPDGAAYVATPNSSRSLAKLGAL
jgi:hypothetical protein